MRIGNKSCFVCKIQAEWNNACSQTIRKLHLCLTAPGETPITVLQHLGPTTEETGMPREERRWWGGFKHTVFSLYGFMRCLVYNVLYRTAIQEYRVSFILFTFYGEKNNHKKEIVFPYYVDDDNLLCPCWIVPIVRVLLISWSYKLMRQECEHFTKKKREIINKRRIICLMTLIGMSYEIPLRMK